MARQLVAICIAALLSALSVHAQDLTVVIYVPFVAFVPPATGSPGLAGFKDRVKQAFQGSLQYINDLTGAGLGSAPSIKPIYPKWVYSEASATATFPYTEAWLGPLQYLIAAPTTLYYYNNATNSAGFKLINIYDAVPEGTIVDILYHSPPPPPPSPPSPPRDNSSVDFRAISSLYSADIPLQSDTASFTVFLNTYFESFATMMNCASNTNTSSAGTNGTALADLCANSTTNGTNSTGFPSQPTSSNVTQVLIPDPNAAAPAHRRSRSLLRTAPFGFVWNVTIIGTYAEINVTFTQVYAAAQDVIVQGQKAIIIIVLVLDDLIIVQIGVFVLPNGDDVPFTPEVPGYGTATDPAGRRRLIQRRAAALPHGAAAGVEWADVDPSDIAYGTDKSMYEIFSTTADYFTAGAACAARGAKLASYSSEGSQIFIDILCDSTPGMHCWVEGNSNGACTAVSASTLHAQSCGKQMPFVCVKDKSAITTRTVSSNSATVAEIAAAKPTDAATDTLKNLYEMYSTPVSYYTAGSVCTARGGQLANYGTEGAQVFIDVLCSGAAGHTCWVEGNKAGRCSAVRSSDVQQVSCTGVQPFVCVKSPSAKNVD